MFQERSGRIFILEFKDLGMFGVRGSRGLLESSSRISKFRFFFFSLSWYLTQTQTHFGSGFFLSLIFFILLAASLTLNYLSSFL